MVFGGTPELTAACPIVMTSFVFMSRSAASRCACGCRAPAPQQERIRYDAHGRQRHRSARNHRTQQSKRSRGQAYDVVDERPEESLPDLAVGGATHGDGVA